LAFAADPVERWLYPEPLIYASNMTLAPKQFSSADYAFGTDGRRGNK
jgi:hypothetical protein